MPVEHSTLVLPNPNAVKVQNVNRMPSYSNNVSPIRNVSKHRPKSLTISGNNNPKSSEMKPMSFEWIEDKLSGGNTSNNRTPGAECEDGRQFCCQNAQDVERLRYKIEFCARHMTKNLETIQSFINGRNKDLPQYESDAEVDSALIAIAEMKKIRDILKGTISFENSLN